MNELFNLQPDDATYAYRASMLEVYNETILDLLAFNKGKSSGTPKLEVRQTATGHSVPGLTEVAVDSLDAIQRLMQRGSAQRSVGGHDLNAHSSRSHLILTLHIECTRLVGGGGGGANGLLVSKTTSSKLNLIDLAGSERLSKTGATGERLKEAQNINKSLSALGEVINSLSSKHGHVPYRNSKLTFLLQDSLSRNAKVLMLVNISPAESNASESICSLSFAARCRDVALGDGRESAELDKARKHIRMLQSRLSK